ncbi:MAG: site-specific integrase [Bacteroidia bacterium]
MSEKFVNAYITLKTDRARKDGTYPLYLRLTIERKIKNYPLKKFITLEDWDDVQREVRKSYPLHKDLNLFLSQKLTSAKHVIYRLENSSKPVTFNTFENEYFGKFAGDFFKYAESQMKLWQPKLAEQTYGQYESDISKLKKYNPSFFLSDVDNDFLKRYEAYMRGTLKNKTNTVSKSMKVLRTFIIAAYDDDLIPRNPFKKYKLKFEDSDRTFLTIEEVDILEEYYKKCTSKKFKNVIRYFLFCCYTGLRWGGVKELKFTDIRDGIVYMHGAEIPLTSRANALIDWGRPQNGTVFDVIARTTSNEIIKLVFQAVNITRVDQTLTFHSSRHTFGTISLNIGIPMDIVQSMYGHKNPRTTRIYAKLIDKTKKNAMKAWDNLNTEEKKG